MTLRGVLLAAAAVLVLSLGGCSTPTIATTATNNADVPVSLMFDFDGCKVYRFEADGHSRYFVRCRASGAQVLSSHCEMQGKQCVHVDDSIPEATP